MNNEIQLFPGMNIYNY